MVDNEDKLFMEKKLVQYSGYVKSDVRANGEASRIAKYLDASLGTPVFSMDVPVTKFEVDASSYLVMKFLIAYARSKNSSTGDVTDLMLHYHTVNSDIKSGISLKKAISDFNVFMNKTACFDDRTYTRLDKFKSGLMFKQVVKALNSYIPFNVISLDDCLTERLSENNAKYFIRFVYGILFDNQIIRLIDPNILRETDFYKEATVESLRYCYIDNVIRMVMSVVSNSNITPAEIDFMVRWTIHAWFN